jgi:SOS-response transcriptional repressor LexA
MREATEKEARFLEVVARLLEVRGPTVRELRVASGFRSTCTVQRKLASLGRKGLLCRLGGARGYVPTAEGQVLLGQRERKKHG